MSCKKDKSVTANPSEAKPVKIGLFEARSGIYKLLFINVSKVGTQTVNDQLIFDTGSAGMILDADSIVPKSMIASTGFNFSGDSTVINGITITSKKGSIIYGSGDDITSIYGNLAYANVTVGDENGNIVVKRLPFFLYYEGINADGTKAAPHSFDIFGVDPEYDPIFDNGASLQSPFLSYQPGSGLKTGFKMAALGTSHFTTGYNYVPGVITVGLTSTDISSTGSGFAMHQLDALVPYGYSTVISADVMYNKSKTLKSNVVFDTGSEPYSYIPDRSVSGSMILPQGSKVSLTTDHGFSTSYTTAANEYLTVVGNPSVLGSFTIFGIDFFLNNSYMINYTDHIIGLKSN